MELPLAHASSGRSPPAELDQHRLLAVVHQAAARILSEGDWRSHVERMLAEVGEVMGVSRVVLNRNRIDASGRYEQEDLFEWDAPGVTRVLGNPELPVLDIKDEAFQDWRERRSRGEVVQGITRELPEGMRAWLTMQGVRSALRVPVFVGKEWWGSIGFDECDRERLWSPIEIDSLWTAAALVGIAVEHDRSRQALRQSEREAARKAVFLQAVLDGVAQGVNAFDADLNLQFANEQFLKLFHFPPELGRPGTPFSELLRHRWRTGVRASGSRATDEDSYVSEQLARWRAMFTAEPELRVEERRPDGPVVDVWRRPLPGGGFVTTFTDMTEQIRMREALLEDERRLRDILEANPLPLLIVREASDRVVYANKRAADLFGYAARELTGRKSADLFGDPDDRHRVYEALKAHHLVDGMELAVCRADGSTFAVELTCRPITFGRKPAIVAGVYDLTERKRAEAEIARQREALYQSEKLTALGSLLAGVAHELNNPLSVVVSQAALMQETASDPRTAERAAKIQAAADRCARIVKSFLAIARQRPAARSAVKLDSLVQMALDLTSYGLSSSGIAVEVDVPADLPELWADGDQLVQVFMNLIVNAQQVLQDTEGPRRLRLAARTDGPSHLRVTVSDNGPGIPRPIRSRIFEPFFTTKPVGSGTGIGLSLCLGTIVAHGGSIDVEESLGGGATFVIRIPHAAATQESSDSQTIVAPTSGKTILIVDDEVEIAEMLAEIVAPLASKVDVADSGAAALRKLETQAYDLIISDLRMPELDGPGLYRRLQDLNGGARGPILFISGDTLGHNLDAFLRETGCPFLDKPFTPAEVRERVAALL